MSQASDFVGELFVARDVAHSIHLNTRSYSKHVALNAFYDEIVGLADDFAEAFQGRYGMIGPVTMSVPNKPSNALDFLTKSLERIESARYQVVPKTDTALQNIVDEIVSLYLSTLYKLKFLA